MYVTAEISYEGNHLNVVIAVGIGYNERYDDRIFYYVDTEEDLESLKDEGVEDFTLLRVLEQYEDIEDILNQ